MTDNTPNRIDEKAARAHLDTILTDHEQAFETFFLARFLNLSFDYLPTEALDADKEVCRVSFPMSDMLKNPQGSLHGGVMATAMDISMGHLVQKVAGPGATIELKVQFMRPVTEGIVTCEAGLHAGAAHWLLWKAACLVQTASWPHSPQQRGKCLNKANPVACHCCRLLAFARVARDAGPHEKLRRAFVLPSVRQSRRSDQQRLFADRIIEGLHSAYAAYRAGRGRACC